MPCLPRRINNGELTQDAAEELWSKHAENGLGEREFADFWNAVNKFPDHGRDDTDSEYDTDDGDGPIIDRHGASPQVEDAVPPEGGNGEGGGGPLHVPRDDGPDAGGDSEEDKSLEEDDEADDEVDLLKSEVADLRAVLRNRTPRSSTSTSVWIRARKRRTPCAAITRTSSSRSGMPWAVTGVFGWQTRRKSGPLSFRELTAQLFIRNPYAALCIQATAWKCKQ